VASTVVFFHAHPDDEAIFTGGTMRLLADAGHRVVLLVATGGEAGERGDSVATESLADRRRAETEAAAALLGVDRIVHLGGEDSGVDGANPNGFCRVKPGVGAALAEARLDHAGIEPDALVIYDGDGIYGHPDHVAVHEVGHALGGRLGVSHVYESTVDREYLHFVESHLVVEAGLPEWPLDLGLAASNLGRPTVLIDTEIDIQPVLEVKRAAMAAHGSQIPASSSALQLPSARFADVYGLEWYVRHGPPGPLEALR
jgi:LmbE family N-acetylglucosaminyl deacetylase